MKTFKFILVGVLTVNIALGLSIYFLNINLFSILQIENTRFQIQEPRYNLNASSNQNYESSNQIFFLYDSECKKYGPFELQETSQKIQNGLLAYCNKEIVKEKIFKYTIKIADFYYKESANNMLDRIINETGIKSPFVKTISKTKYRVLLGPFNDIKKLEDSFNKIKSLDFENIEILKNV